MTKIPALIICLYFTINVQGQTKAPIQIGETIEIQSTHLQEIRRLHIYLPQEFGEKPEASYNVVYLLDGGLDEDFLHISGVIQFLSFPWINVLPPSILVAIENVDRTRDFTFPTEIPIDKVDFPSSGGSAAFIDFLKLEVQPYIQEEYNGRGQATLIGQSFGGLLATEILFSNSDMFDHYVIVSPSLWWNKQSLLELPLNDKFGGKSVYIGVGKEGEIMENDAKSLFDKINHNEKVYFQFLEAQNHGDALHLAVYSAFEKIFKSTGQ